MKDKINYEKFIKAQKAWTTCMICHRNFQHKSKFNRLRAVVKHLIDEHEIGVKKKNEKISTH